MEILEVADGDIPAAISLWEQCKLLRPWNDPRADIERARRASDAAVFVGKLDAAIVATVMVGFDGHRGWVYYLAVKPEVQRSGFGRAMLNAAEKWLRARKAPKLMLMVGEENAAALGFYSALGLERSPVVTLGKILD